MLVRNIMNRRVIVAKPDISIKEASKIMDNLHIGSLIIMEEGKIVGIVTSSDILRAIAENKDPETTILENIMSKNVVTIEPDKKIEDAVDLMIKYKIKKLPVVENNELVGIVTASDIIVVEPTLIKSIASLVSIKLPGYRGG